MKALVVTLAALLWSALGAAQQGTSEIDKFFQVDERVFTGGQPTAEQLAALKAAGIRSILSLREPEEHNAGEEQAAAELLGLRYMNIPVRASEPRAEQADAFLAALDTAEVFPIFIHCGSGNRVGAFWMIRRMVVDGWSASAAEVEARRIGLTSTSLRDFAVSYARSHQDKRILTCSAGS